MTFQDFHGSENLDCGLLGYDAVWSCRWLPTFREILLTPSSGWESFTFASVFQTYACISFTRRPTVDVCEVTTKFKPPGVDVPVSTVHEIGLYPFFEAEETAQN
jgi:hypothetical protein